MLERRTERKPPRILKEEGPQLVDVVDEQLRRQADEVGLAVRIEEEIAKKAPMLGETLRLESHPYWVVAEQHRLLAQDAPTYPQRVWASWFYENLRERVKEAREAGRTVTPGEVRQYHEQYRHRQLSEANRARLAVWEKQGYTVDFSLAHVMGAAKRHLLLAYRLRDDGIAFRHAYRGAREVHRILHEITLERPASGRNSGPAPGPMRAPIESPSVGNSWQPATNT